MKFDRVGVIYNTQQCLLTLGQDAGPGRTRSSPAQFSSCSRRRCGSFRRCTLLVLRARDCVVANAMMRGVDEKPPSGYYPGRLVLDDVGALRDAGL